MHKDLPAAQHPLLLLLHLASGRDGWWRTGDATGGGVDDRDCVARALSERFVQMHVVLLVNGRRNERVGIGDGELHVRGRLDLSLDRGGLRRATGHGRTVGGRGTCRLELHDV